jgi:predicted nucleic acid-binding protein
MVTTGTTTLRSGYAHSVGATSGESADDLGVALLLDTTVLIDVLRGRPAAHRLAALRRSSAPPYVCAVSVEELWRGVRPSEEAAVQRFFAALRIAPLGRAEGERAGIWRRRFAEQGVTLSQADCLIAAAAAGIGARVASGNPGHFPMDELVVEHWPVGA